MHWLLAEKGAHRRSYGVLFGVLVVTYRLIWLRDGRVLPQLSVRRPQIIIAIPATIDTPHWCRVIGETGANFIVSENSLGLVRGVRAIRSKSRAVYFDNCEQNYHYFLFWHRTWPLKSNIENIQKLKSMIIFSFQKNIEARRKIIASILCIWRNRQKVPVGHQVRGFDKKFDGPKFLVGLITMTSQRILRTKKCIKRNFSLSEKRNI